MGMKVGRTLGREPLNPSEQPFAGNNSQKGEIRKDKTELEEATGLTPTSEMIRNQIQKIEVPGKILLC